MIDSQHGGRIEKIILYLALYTQVKIGSLDKQIKRETHRMSFFTWFLVNPINIIVLPVGLLIFTVLALNNFDAKVLTESQNIAIFVALSFITTLISFGNKLYEIIQENCDMNIVKELENRLEAKFTKQQTQEQSRYEKQRAEDQARFEKQRAEEQARYDRERQEFLELFKQLGGDVSKLKEKTSYLEGKQENN